MSSVFRVILRNDGSDWASKPGGHPLRLVRFCVFQNAAGEVLNRKCWCVA